ncbi:MAG: hypothetical protein OXQ29_15150 [Rhodospirillaceae bacterium]|nr:hypothetical protein [Rhodospirillaceae bacterium]
MRQFHIFEHAHPDQGCPQHVAVKDGWCWPALCGTWAWALATRLHGVAVKILAGWLGIIVVFYFILTRLTPETSIWIFIFLLLIGNVVARFVCGAYGNQWRRTYLTQRGYWLAETVSAPTRAAALAAVQEASSC